jgi:predicted nucleotidyltransferase
MHRHHNPNLQLLEIAVAQLGPLTDELVLVGGCATGLLVTDSAAPPARVTQDVDVTTEVGSISHYHCLLASLRQRGFKEDIIAVLDGRPEVVSEIQQAEPRLRTVLTDRFMQLLSDASFEQAVPGHLLGDAASQARAPLILERMRQIAETNR